MARFNPRLEAEGTEFLVLGALLIEGITAHKTYTNVRGYDLVPSDADNRTLCHIQVKSRWATDYDGGFIIKDLDHYEFVVFVELNHGYRYRRKPTAADTGKKAPRFFVFPAPKLRKVPRSKGWGKLFLKDIRAPEAESYVEQWHLISDELRLLKKGWARSGAGGRLRRS